VVADVATLRSFPSQAFAPSRSVALTYRVEQGLIENRVPFQILGSPQLDDLKSYRALVLAGCPALSDADLERIRRYVDSGGALCLVGPTATHDAWMRERPQPGLKDLSGKRVIRIDSAENLLNAVHQACGGGPSVAIEAPAGLAMELTDRADARLLHLVNYREDGPLGEVGVRIRVPSGRHVTKVTLAGPSHEKDLVLPFTVDLDTVTFTVPRIDIYEVAVLTMN